MSTGGPSGYWSLPMFSWSLDPRSPWILECSWWSVPSVAVSGSSSLTGDPPGPTTGPPCGSGAAQPNHSFLWPGRLSPRGPGSWVSEVGLADLYHLGINLVLPNGGNTRKEKSRHCGNYESDNGHPHAADKPVTKNSGGELGSGDAEKHDPNNGNTERRTHLLNGPENTGCATRVRDRHLRECDIGEWHSDKGQSCTCESHRENEINAGERIGFVCHNSHNPQKTSGLCESTQKNEEFPKAVPERNGDTATHQGTKTERKRSEGRINGREAKPHLEVQD